MQTFTDPRSEIQRELEQKKQLEAQVAELESDLVSYIKWADAGHRAGAMKALKLLQRRVNKAGYERSVSHKLAIEPDDDQAMRPQDVQQMIQEREAAELRAEQEQLQEAAQKVIDRSIRPETASEEDIAVAEEARRAAYLSEIGDRFTYHPPTDAKRKAHVAMRDFMKDTGLHVADVLPDSREKSVALTKLEEALFWANAAIARNDLPE